MTSQILIDQQSTALSTWARLLRGHTATKRQLSMELDREHGLTISDYECLLVLSHAEDNRMRRVDLARDLMLTPSGVTRLLDGLEQAGFVEKATCDTDARVTYAVLTEPGREKLRAASHSHLSGVRQLFEQLYSEDELATLAELLARLPDAAAADPAACASED